MLGGYAVGVPVPRTQNHADLERYLRMEYNGRMNVATLLAESARVSRKARTKDRRGFAGRIRAFTAALRSIAAGRPSKVSTPEV